MRILTAKFSPHDSHLKTPIASFTNNSQERQTTESQERKDTESQERKNTTSQERHITQTGNTDAGHRGTITITTILAGSGVKMKALASTEEPCADSVIQLKENTEDLSSDIITTTTTEEELPAQSQTGKDSSTEVYKVNRQDKTRQGVLDEGYAVIRPGLPFGCGSRTPRALESEAAPCQRRRPLVSLLLDTRPKLTVTWPERVCAGRLGGVCP